MKSDEKTFLVCNFFGLTQLVSEPIRRREQLDGFVHLCHFMTMSHHLTLSQSTACGSWMPGRVEKRAHTFPHSKICKTDCLTPSTLFYCYNCKWVGDRFLACCKVDTGACLFVDLTTLDIMEGWENPENMWMLDAENGWIVCSKFQPNWRS